MQCAQCVERNFSSSLRRYCRVGYLKFLAVLVPILGFSCRVVVFVSSTYGSSGTLGIVCYAHSVLNLVRAHLASAIFLCHSDDVVYLDGGDKICR